MSKEMTAEEYLKVIEKYPLSLQAVHVEYYGDLRAKEAVKEFAEELISVMEKSAPISYTDKIKFAEIVKYTAKQKGVDI